MLDLVGGGGGAWMIYISLSLCFSMFSLFLFLFYLCIVLLLFYFGILCLLGSPLIVFISVSHIVSIFCIIFLFFVFLFWILSTFIFELSLPLSPISIAEVSQFAVRRNTLDHTAIRADWLYSVCPIVQTCRTAFVFASDYEHWISHVFFFQFSLSVAYRSLLGREEIGFVLWSERVCIFTLFRILTGYLYL